MQGKYTSLGYFVKSKFVARFWVRNTNNEPIQISSVFLHLKGEESQIRCFASLSMTLVFILGGA